MCSAALYMVSFSLPPRRCMLLTAGCLSGQRVQWMLEGVPPFPHWSPRMFLFLAAGSAVLCSPPWWIRVRAGVLPAMALSYPCAARELGWLEWLLRTSYRCPNPALPEPWRTARLPIRSSSWTARTHSRGADVQILTFNMADFSSTAAPAATRIALPPTPATRDCRTQNPFVPPLNSLLDLCLIGLRSSNGWNRQRQI